MSGFWDHVVDLLWAPFLVIVTWAFQLDRRVSRLETQREAMVAKIDDIDCSVKNMDAKIDKLVDKLL